jgi:acyl dehydratase
MLRSDCFLGQIFSLAKRERLDTARIAAFAEISGDASPSHLSDTQAQAVGFPRALAHGMLGMAFFGRLIVDHFPQSQLRTLRSRFVAMTFHGDLLECTATVDNIDADRNIVHLSLLAINQHGQTVLTGAAQLSMA